MNPSVGGPPMWIIAWVETNSYSASELGGVLAVLGWTPLLSTFEFLPATLLMRESRFATISQINIGRALVNSGTVVALAWTGWSYLSPALAALMSAGFSLLAYNIVGRRFVSLRVVVCSLAGDA